MAKADTDLPESAVSAYLLGPAFALPLAVAIWYLLMVRHPLGMVCIAIRVLTWCFVIRRPIFITISIAWFFGAVLAMIFWKP